MPGAYVRSLSDALSGLADTSGPRDLIASVESPAAWADERLLQSLGRIHEGVACLLVFHPTLHPTFSGFVAAGGPDLLSRKRLLFLIHTERRLFGPEPLEKLFSQATPTDSHPNVLECVRDAFPQSRSLAFPGLLFFPCGEPDEGMLYVPLSATSVMEDLGSEFASIIRTVEEHLAADRWPEAAGNALANRGIDYARTDRLSTREKVVRLLRLIWKAKSDISILLSIM